MEMPQFKNGNVGTYNEQRPLYEMRAVDARSLVSLHFSQFILLLGIILILLNNLNVLAPGSYFGAINWVTSTVFSLGLIINYLSIPYLYFSSFRNYKRENDFWDKQTFWILPLFFFGTFFLHGSQFSLNNTLLIISVVLISAIHFHFLWCSRNMDMAIQGEALASYKDYFTSLKYLTAYYLLLLLLLVIIDPLQQFFIWIRMTF